MDALFVRGMREHRQLGTFRCRQEGASTPSTAPATGPVHSIAIVNATVRNWRPDALLVVPVGGQLGPLSLSCAPRLCGLRDFVEPPRLHFVDIAVDWDIARYERMLANAQHVLKHAFFLRLNGVPFYKVARRAAAAMLRVRPVLAIKARGGEIVLQQAGNNLIAEQFHTAIGMVDDEPFVR